MISFSFCRTTAPSRSLFDDPSYRAWSINRAEDFTDLRVGSQLTTPYVAKYYGQHDENGNIYITFDKNDKRYIPGVTLRRVDYDLLFQDDMHAAFAARCFEVADVALQKRLIEAEVRITWCSSPRAMTSILRRILDTPNGPHSYEVAFVRSLEERKKLLKPLLEKFAQLRYVDDPKLMRLLTVLRHLESQGHKAIIFCERLPTAAYLEDALRECVPSLRVFCTVQQTNGTYKQKRGAQVADAIEKFAPVANAAIGKHSDSFDVFISTDAHGVGINLQDAPVVINYDLDWTPIDPVQRAGRILRPWQESPHR